MSPHRFLDEGSCACAVRPLRSGGSLAARLSRVGSAPGSTLRCAVSTGPSGGEAEPAAAVGVDELAICINPRPSPFSSLLAFGLMNMKKKTLRSISVAAAASFCLEAAILGTSASDSVASPQNSQVAPAELKCYTTISDPNAIVCYRVSKRILNRGGQITFFPFLIQVPTPSNAPAPVVVNVLPPPPPDLPGELRPESSSGTEYSPQPPAG